MIRLCVVFAVLNALLLVVAFFGQGRGAIGLAIIIGPVVNFIAGFLGFNRSPIVEAEYGRAVRSNYVTCCILAPIVAVVFDIGAVIVLGWAGC